MIPFHAIARMRRIGAILGLGLLPGLVLATPGTASAPKHGSGDGAAPPAEHGGEGEKKTVSALDPKNVEVPVVTAPLVNGQGRLMGYAFVGVRIRAREPGAAETIKTDLPVAQDAIIRAINLRPARVGLEEEELKALLLEEIKQAVSAVLPGDVLEAVELRDLVISDL